MREKGRERWREKGKEKRHGGWFTPNNHGGRHPLLKKVVQPKERDITHYFFSNFPENFSEKHLWTIFQRYENVWEVFIAPKRDKKGKRFGFVRFTDVKNPVKLERELDTILIGNMKMHVNFPRFEKKKPRETGSFRQPVRDGTKKPGTAVPGIKPKNHTQKLANIAVKSYARAVSSEPGILHMDMKFDASKDQPRPPIENWNGPIVHDGFDWLKRSMVGVIKNMDLIPSLQNAAMIEGLKYIQIRYLGDDFVLLTGPEDLDLEEALKGTDEGPDAVFDVLYPWSPLDAPDYRVTWLRCTGLPVHMWDKECFAEMVKPVGDLISIDAQTSSFSRLEFAKILVRTNCPYRISHYRRVNINGVVYHLRLMEDFTPLCRSFQDENDADDMEEGNDWAQFDDGFEEDTDESLGGDNSFFVSPPTTAVQAEDGVNVETPSAINASVGESNEPDMGNSSSHDGRITPEDEELQPPHNDEGITAVNDCLRPALSNYSVAESVVGPKTGGPPQLEPDASNNNSESISPPNENVGVLGCTMIHPSLHLGPSGVGNLDPNPIQNFMPELHPLLPQGDANPTDGGIPNSQFENRDISLEDVGGIQNDISTPNNVNPFTQGGGRQKLCDGSIDLNSGSREVVANVALRNQFDVLTRRVRPRSSVDPLQSNSVSQSVGSMQRRTLRMQSSLDLRGSSFGSEFNDFRKTLWLQGRTGQAELIWELGKKCGASYSGREDEVISKLKELQSRDEAGAVDVTQRVNGGNVTHNQ